MFLEWIMGDQDNFPEQLHKLNIIKNSIVFGLFPSLLLIFSLLISHYFNMSRFSYISVLILISLAIATMVLLGAYLFSVIQDEALIKKTINKN